MADSEWVDSFVDQNTIDEGGVKIHLPSLGDETSFDTEIPFDSPPPGPAGSFSEEQDPSPDASFGGLQGQIANQIAGSVLSGQILKDTSQQAKSFFDLNSHIDWVRPHFDVNPNEIFNRLMGSIVPGMRTDFGEGNADLYGPSMIVFTLISIFVFTMKEEALTRTENDGIIMGAAFGLSFTFWGFSSLWYYTIVFATTINVSFLHVLSASGYAMIGFCISLLPQLFLLPQQVTLACFVVFGLLSGASLGLLFFQRAGGRGEGGKGVLVGGLIFATHLLLCCYLYYYFVKGTNTKALRRLIFWEGL